MPKKLIENYAAPALWDTTSRCDGHCGQVGKLYQYTRIESGKIVDPVFYCDQCRNEIEDETTQQSRIARFACGALNTPTSCTQ